MPSLRALRAFQVAGARLSLSDAADELHITASGVSHQIRLLEEDLGTKLFYRRGRGLELTERGAELLPLLTQIFDELGAVIADFKGNGGGNSVSIAMPATFASRWFIPNLGKFESLHPDIEITLTCQEARSSMMVKGVDCVIRYGESGWTGFEEHMLFSEKLIVVCSPRLMKGGALLRSEDIARFRLLKVESNPGEWETWARATGVKLPEKPKSLTFETRELALQSSFEGLGLALAGIAEVAEDIRQGRLAVAFDSAQIYSGTYFLLVSLQKANRPSVAALSEWIQLEYSEQKQRSE